METKQVREIKVFLASSNETFDERVQFGDFVSGLNSMFSSVNIQFLLHKWEYFSADIAPRDKQEEYNDKVRESEICIVLFWRRLGWFTQRELNAALEAQKADPKSKRVFVYLKAIDGQTEISPDDLQKLKDFKDHFYERCQNWPTEIHSNDEFKLNVLQNLIIYLNEGGAGISPFSATEGIIDIGGKTSIDLKNVPFIGDNEEYKLLCETIDLYERTLKTLKPEDLEYSKCAAQLIERKDRRDAMENGLLETALTVSKLKTTRCSERLKQAIALFEKGDSRGAQAILDTEAITKDVQANKDLIEAGNELVDKGREGLKTNLNEYLLRIDLLTDEMKEGWKEEVELLFEKCFEIGEDNLEKKRYADLLSQYSLYLNTIAEYEKALEYGIKALDLSRSIFGENHPDTALAYDSVSHTYSSLGNYKQALECDLKALSIRRSSYGEKHSSVALSYNNLGTAYTYLGDYKKALKYYLKALDIQLSLGRENHISVAHLYNNLGSLYGSIGDRKESLEYHLKALSKMQSLFGEKDPVTATAYNNVGDAYYEFGNPKMALEYLLKALDIYHSIFGKNHPNVALTYNNIGNIYGELGYHKKALQFKEKALAIWRSFLKEDNPNLATGYDSTGFTYGDLGNYKKELEYHLKALDLRLTALKKDHPSVATSYDSIGFTYTQLGDYKKALEYLLKSLDLQRSIYGDNNPSVARTYDNIGLTYGQLGDYKKALKHQLKSLDIKLTVLEKNHPDIATSYNNTGLTYGNMGDYNNALKYLMKALDIVRINFGENHPTVAKIYLNLGDIYQNMGDYASSTRCYFKASVITAYLNKRDEENSHL